MNDPAILISAFSFAVAALALGWTIRRDLVRPRVKIEIGARHVDENGLSRADLHPLTNLVIKGTNYGPGAIHIDNLLLHVWYRPWWYRLICKRAVTSVIDLTKGIQPERGPQYTIRKLEMGEPVTKWLPWNEHCFLGQPVTHVGFVDTLNRYHWAPRADVAEVRRLFSTLR